MDKKKIYLIGDSTCHTNNSDTYPQTGWGQVFGDYINNTYEVVNLAQNGRSSKSFKDEGWFEVVERNIDKGDYLFIQFGHNDEKDDELRHTDPYSTYQENLLYYINVARNKGATPILLSSIYRRHFDNNGKIEEYCHKEYPNAMKELSLRENVVYLDICEKTKQMLIELGDENSKELFMNFDKGMYKNYPDGKNDDTHLREKGARKVVLLIIEEIKKIPQLREILR